LSGATGGGFTGEQYQKIVNDYADMKAKLDSITGFLQNPASGPVPADTLGPYNTTGLNLDVS